MAALNKDLAVITNLVEEFNSNLRTLKDLTKTESSRKEYEQNINEIREQNVKISKDIHQKITTGRFTTSENSKLQKIKKDFETMLKSFSDICNSLKENKKVEVQEIRKRASVIGEVKEKKEKKEKDDDEDIEIEVQTQHFTDMIQEKDKEIAAMEKEAVLIHDMMKDVNEMVVDQGKTLDSLEMNLVQTQDRVKSSQKNMTGAKDIQDETKKNQLRYMLCGLLWLFIIGSILIVFTKLKLFQSHQSPIHFFFYQP
eukprot:TRINITY_DN1778_c0_g1_i2.p1 TRINITY_DN1778_c0_g1~~TRINITY_DN1778_c0_g1_i2.p1  ORF type:complete len:255 (+),score=88.89 TRINITY_DN1778_c0_g1_i2:76-840(+)